MQSTPAAASSTEGSLAEFRNKYITFMHYYRNLPLIGVVIVV